MQTVTSRFIKRLYLSINVKLISVDSSFAQDQIMSFHFHSKRLKCMAFYVAVFRNLDVLLILQMFSAASVSCDRSSSGRFNNKFHHENCTSA